MRIPTTSHKRLVIIGGGFAGLNLARGLDGTALQVILLNATNYFNFQPLLYQVATGGLEPNSIAYPLRRIFQGANNVSVRVAEVMGIRPSSRTIQTSQGSLTYDYAVIATGSRPNFFGLDPDVLLPLKSVPDALRLRNWILTRMEEALVEKDPSRKKAMMNFIIVGGGPTGVELAGALAEMKRWVLPSDYPDLDLRQMRIHLLEGENRLLPAMSEKASARAREYLEGMGVNIHLQKLIKEYDGRCLELGGQRLNSRNLIWTAGVKAQVPGGLLERAETEKGRLLVDRFHQVQGMENVFAIGDVAHMPTDDFPNGHPMLAPVAIQQGRHLASNIKRRLRGKKETPFTYTDRGAMATIGRNKAVADLPRIFLHGFPAWLAWMLVHIITLVGFRNRLIVLINWMYSYLTYDKALRLIIRKPEDSKRPIGKPEPRYTEEETEA